MRLAHYIASTCKVLNLAHYSKSLIFSKVYFFIIKNNSFDLFIKKWDLSFTLLFFKLNQNLKFDTLFEISVVDYPQKLDRFKIVYCLISYFNNVRLYLHTFVKEATFLNSVRCIFPSAGWLEREAWDLFGIFFINHNDLRRILTDYGFRGYPFRKDFPLTGYIELRHDDSKGDIVYEPLELTQELRFFNFATGWEKDQ